MLALVLACGISLSASTVADRNSKQAIADEIIALEKASFKAWQRKDKQFYAEYWADDFSEFLPQSSQLTANPKANLLPDLEKSFDDWNLIDIQMHDPRVKIYKDIALLTYAETVEGSFKGDAVKYEGKVTMVYVKKDGRWRGLHYHESRTCAAK